MVLAADDYSAAAELRVTLSECVERLLAVIDIIDGDVDLEDGHDAEADDADREASLGSCSLGDSQEHWSAGAGDDVEHDPAEVEPSLGAPEGRLDQTGWADGGAWQNDREADDCDDEADDTGIADAAGAAEQGLDPATRCVPPASARAARLRAREEHAAILASARPVA